MVDDDRPPAVDVPAAEVEEGVAFLRGRLNKTEADSLNQGAEQLGVLGRDMFPPPPSRETVEEWRKAVRATQELAAQTPLTEEQKRRTPWCPPTGRFDFILK